MLSYPDTRLSSYDHSQLQWLVSTNSEHWTFVGVGLCWSSVTDGGPILTRFPNAEYSELIDRDIF